MRYWIGGSGNWSDTAHWSTTSGGTGGAAVPTSSDDVYFDANSFTGTNDTVLTGWVYCRNMDWTGATGTPHFKGDDIGTVNLYGNLTFIEDMYVYDDVNDYPGTGDRVNINIYVYGANTDRTIQPAGQHWTFFMWDNVVGTEKITLLGDLTVEYLEIYWGTFDANDFNIKTSGYIWFQALDEWGDVDAYMGSGTWTISGDSPDGLYVYDDNNSVVNIYPETSNMVLTENSQFTGGDKNYNNLTIQAAVNNLWFYGSNTFNNFAVNGGSALYLQNGSTQTVNSFVATGSSGNTITIRPIYTLEGREQATFTKSSGLVECDYLDLQLMNATGGAAWFAGSNSVDSGNNTGWYFEDYGLNVGDRTPLPSFKHSV